jgi:hypothetical protein
MVCFQTESPVLVYFRSPLTEKFDSFYEHLVYFVAIWFISWQFGIHMFWRFVKISPFWYIVARKIWQPYITLRHERQSFSSSRTKSRFETKHPAPLLRTKRGQVFFRFRTWAVKINNCVGTYICTFMYVLENQENGELVSRLFFYVRYVG